MVTLRRLVSEPVLLQGQIAEVVTVPNSVAYNSLGQLRADYP
jgi:hypothetical protein